MPKICNCKGGSDKETKSPTLRDHIYPNRKPKHFVRCRKKGEFVADLQKTKFVIDLYLDEYKEEHLEKQSHEN